MIVDDDPQFLASTEGLLGPQRELLFAGSAEQARNLMRTIGADVDLALIDLNMHQDDGFALIAEMHRNFPDLPLVAMSGVVQNTVLNSALLVGAVAALQKPISPEWNSAIARARAAA